MMSLIERCCIHFEKCILPRGHAQTTSVSRNCSVLQSILLRISAVILLSPGIMIADEIPLSAIDGWPGTLIIVGGGHVPTDVKNVLKESVSNNGSLVVIAEAASDPRRAADIASKWLGESGISNVVVIDSSLEEHERWSRTETAIDSSSAVWICGGQQSRLASAFAGSEVEVALQRLLQRGGTIGGTSAGAAIMSKVMIASGSAQPEISEGWDLLPCAIIDQHFTKRKRITRSQIALEMHPMCFGIGIDEATAVFVKRRQMQVTGEGGVTLLLASSNHRDAEVTRLLSGDHADLTQLRRAARQRAARIDPGEPQHGGPKVESGSLVIVGGGAMPDDVVDRFLELAGRENANIVVLPTGVSREEASRQVPGFLRKAILKSVTVLPQRGLEEMTDAEFQTALKSASGIWFGGGRQWNFVDAYEGTDAIELFRNVLRRGGVIGGSSAGATIQGEFLVRGHPLGNSVMLAEGYERGFAFLPGTAIDQHFTQRDRQPDLLAVLRRHPKLLGIGIDEGTAIVVQGTKLDVIGQHSAHFVSAKQLSSVAADQPLPTTSEEAATLYLSVATGESLDLKSFSE